MIPRIIVYSNFILTVMVGCWYVSSDTTGKRTNTNIVLTRIIPDTLDHHTVYPTNHVTLGLDPMQNDVWQELTIPTAWANGDYYFEIWDSSNRPVPGFLAQRLLQSTIALDSIDASLYPSIRLIIFKPDSAADLSYQAPLYIRYHTSPNRRLVIMLGIIIIVYGSVLFGLWHNGLSLRRSWLATKQLVRGEHLPIVMLATLTIIWSGIFGIALGYYIGGIQIMYVLIKLPFVLLGALIISTTTLLILSQLLGVRAKTNAILHQAVTLVAITALGLAALTPVLLFYIIYPLNHDAVLLAAVVFFGAGGGLALIRLYLWLRSRCAVLTIPLILTVWFVVYGSVFLQLGWLLRPWVGVLDSVQHNLPFARPYSGNVFVELVNTIERSNN
ncbi:MAG: hypothetical protein HYV33_02975 [Candidatus Kerfeldbacteria bacterium]|nr:hypothetical protein [Candidatus Kerfeldbacteria bacterium]